MWLTQAELAKQVGVSLISVRRWEAGWQPQPEHVRRLCAVLQASPAELGFGLGNDPDAREPVLGVIRAELPNQIAAGGLILLGTLEPVTPEQRSAWGLPPALHMTALGETLTDDMKRREFLNLLGVPAAAVLSRVGLPSLAWDTDGLAPNKAALDGLEAAVAVEKRLCDQLGSRAVQGLATENARLATNLMRSSPPAGLRPRLAVVATEAAVEAGFVCADQHQLPAARSYYQSATELAQEAEDPGLEAFVLGSWSRRLADPYLYAPAAESDNGVRALSFVQRAQIVAAQRPSSLTTMYLATIEAEVQARAGDADASLRALDRVHEAQGRAEPGKDAPWLTNLGVDDAAYLLGSQGYCYMRMGRLDDADAVLAQALSDGDPSFAWARGCNLVDLALVRLKQKELNECCRLAGKGLALASATGSTIIVQRVKDLRIELQPWKGSTAVKDLDEQMAAASWV